MLDGRASPRLAYSDAVTLFTLALGLRILFSLLMANTFDRDEFVFLALGRAVGHGAVPYRDFSFFHPPGILVLIGVLNPLTALWWPLSRLVDVLIDSATAVLVWRVGAQLYGRRAAFVGGALYAANPVVLVSAVRVDVEIGITFLSMLGLMVLLTRSSNRSALVAGACLAAACWIKYPALVFLPVYLVAAPRRATAIALGFVTAATALFLPYLDEARQLIHDTVNWQLMDRHHTPLGIRVAVTAIFWLAIAPLAVVAVLRRRNPGWLLLGFATGGVFLFTSTAYAHYFVAVAPYGALLGAPIAARLTRLPRPMLIAASVALTGVWAAIVLSPASQRFIPTSTFAAARPIVQFIDRSTLPDTPILANSFEYSYLAGRPPLANYYWERHLLVTARELEERLPPGGIVVLYPQRNLSAFPIGLPTYLDRAYAKTHVAGATVWRNAQIADARTTSSAPHALPRRPLTEARSGWTGAGE